MTNFIERFELAFNKLNQAIALCVAATVAAFAVFVPLDFLIRKLRLGGLEWLNEGASYFLFFGVFLSATWVLQQGAHVRVDIIISVLPAKAAKLLERVIDIFGAVLCVVMAYLGLQGARAAYALGTLPDKDLQIPNWIILTVFSVSFVFLAIEFLLRFYRAGRKGYVEEAKVGF